MSRVAVLAAAGLVLACGMGIAVWRAHRRTDAWEGVPLSPEEQRRADASSHNSRAALALQHGKYDEAEREARQAVALDPGWSLAHLSLAMALETTRPDESMREMERAFAIHAAGEAWNDVDLLQAYSTRGRLKDHRRDLEGALADFEAAFQADPRMSVLLGTIALVELHLGRFDDALAHANQCVSINFDQAYPLAARGMIHMACGRFAEAATDYEAAIFLSPRTPAFYSQLGIARLRQGDLDQAEKAFVAAHGFDAKSADAMMGMGSVCAARGKLKDAREYFDAAVQCAPPEAPDIWAERAAFRAKQGDTKGALEDYRKALAVAPPWWPSMEKARAWVDAQHQ